MKSTIIKNTELEKMVIKAGSVMVGTTKIEVAEYVENGITIHLFKCNGKASTSIEDVLPKAITKESIIGALDNFGDKGLELIGKGMKGLGSFFTKVAEKMNK